jgi:hypothetical protein
MSCQLAPTETGQLKPWATLQRFRPLKVGTVQRYLGDQLRLCTAFRRLRQCFPEAMDQYQAISGLGWWEVLAELVNRVEAADWFGVNWALLNQAWAYWMEDETEAGQQLATFLDYLPLTLFGFSRQELYDQAPLELLHALLSAEEIEAVSANLLIDSQIFDSLSDWTGADRQAAWARLDLIETEPDRYPKPICWLPELARWVCDCSGNFILDHQFDPYQPDAASWVRWDDLATLETIKADWPHAQTTISKLEPLLAWYEADPVANLGQLARFLMDDDGELVEW